MNRRKFLQLSSSGSLLLTAFPALSAVLGDNADQNTVMLVSEELIASLKLQWPVESTPTQWLEIQSDPILQFAEFDNQLLTHRVILGVSTWMDYVIMSGLLREQGISLKMIKEQKISDLRGNSLKAYTWVVS